MEEKIVLDGRAVLSHEAVRKVRTPQGRTVANGDHWRSDATVGTGPQKRYNRRQRQKAEGSPKIELKRHRLSFEYSNCFLLSAAAS
jgi:hypothetical protein